MKALMIITALTFCSHLFASESYLEAKNLPKHKLWSYIMGTDGPTSPIHFDIGDEITINTVVSGELFTTTTEGKTIVEVQKEFYIKKSRSGILISWDGKTYKPYKKLVGGELSIKGRGASSTDIDELIISAELNER